MYTKEELDAKLTALREYTDSFNKSPDGYYKVHYRVFADAPVGGVWFIRYYIGQKIAEFGFWLCGLRNVKNTNL